VPRVTLDAESGIRLSPELYRRCGLHLGEELLLEETETGLVLHPLRADVRKVYLEITTRCNLHCRTCVRNAWSEPVEDMADATFDRVVVGLNDGCWGWCPSCADCLWAQGIVTCP
jgi:hypothetical protein